jgi:hypothetical protein
MIRNSLRYLPGVLFAALSLVLYSRAGYGPFGDPQQRGQACTLTRCRHNATTLLGVAAVLLLNAILQARREASQG